MPYITFKKLSHDKTMYDFERMLFYSLFSLKFWKLENWNEILFVFTNVYQVIWTHYFLYNSIVLIEIKIRKL